MLDLGVYLNAWLDAAGALIDLVVWLFGRLGDFIFTVGQALAWFGGLVATIGAAVIAAITNPQAPPEAITAGPIWGAFNDGFQAFRDSPLGWIYWLVIGMLYTFVAVWVLRQFQHLND